MKYGILVLALSTFAAADQWVTPTGQAGQVRWSATDSTGQLTVPTTAHNAITFEPDGLRVDVYSWEPQSFVEVNRFTVEAVAGYTIAGYTVRHLVSYDTRDSWGEYFRYNTNLTPEQFYGFRWSEGSSWFEYEFTHGGGPVTVVDSITLDGWPTGWLAIDRVEYVFDVRPIPAPGVLAVFGLAAMRRRR